MRAPRLDPKRALDLAIAIPTLILAGPAMLAIGLAIRLTSKGPALFVQERAGLGGVPFRLLKFRTMSESPTRDIRGAMAHDDPRITPLGRWLRALSLDELPQLLNVLEGTMSVVGPRPAVLEQIEMYGPFERRRLEVKPGLTGWVQVNGRNALPWPRRMELDVWYVDHRSLALDLRILARTPLTVLCGEGLYGEGGLNPGFVPEDRAADAPPAAQGEQAS